MVERLGNRSKRTSERRRETAHGKTAVRRKQGSVRGFVRRYKRELINGAAGALIAILVTGILGADPLAPARRFVQQQWYEVSTSEEDKVIDEYLYETYSWSGWSQPPTVFEDSVTYFRRHFAELDPRSTHNLTGDLKGAAVQTIVAQAASYSGRLIATGGLIQDEPNKSPAGDYDIWVLQLQAPQAEYNRFTVYVKLSASLPRDFRKGDLVAVEGLVVAAGTVSTKEGGSIDVAYMIGRSFCAEKADCPNYIQG